MLCLAAIAGPLIALSQNVGIGTTTPRGPLSFPPILGEKIILWDNGNAPGVNYGMGIQSGTYQFHTDISGSNFVFGYGSSATFTERLRIINEGSEGMTLNGRLTLKNGTSPLNTGYTPGIWLYKSDNSAILGFMGTENNQNIGFYGGPRGYGLIYNTLNSNVGIGNNNPNVPLAFGAVLGKKISLYPGATGDVGFGVAGNRLQIFSDNPNADVAIGYDAAGTFNERFAVKPNGALAVVGNTGQPGQVLVSNGSGAAASWSNAVGNFYFASQTAASADLTSSTVNPIDIPGLAANFTLAAPARVVFQFRVRVFNKGCFGCGDRRTFVTLFQNISGGTSEVKVLPLYTPDGQFDYVVSGPIPVDLPAGTYSYKVSISNSNYGSATVFSSSDGQLSWQFYNQ